MINKIKRSLGSISICLGVILAYIYLRYSLPSLIKELSIVALVTNLIIILGASCGLIFIGYKLSK